jgi:hypothetical protein
LCKLQMGWVSGVTLSHAVLHSITLGRHSPSDKLRESL